MQMRYTKILKSREVLCKDSVKVLCKFQVQSSVAKSSLIKHPWESIRYFAICSSCSSIALLFCVLAPSAPTLGSSPWASSTSLTFGYSWSDNSACTYRWSYCVFIKGTSPNCSSSTLEWYSVLTGMICALLESNGFCLIIVILYITKLLLFCRTNTIYLLL